MKKTLQICYVFTLVTSLSVQSCKQDIVEVVPATEQKSASDKVLIAGISINQQNGRLVFSDKKQLETTIKKLSELTPAQQGAASANDGFVSYGENLVLLEKKASAKEDLPEEQMKSGKLPRIDSRVLSTILNGSGSIQIGDEVYVVGSTEVHQVKANLFDAMGSKSIEKIPSVQSRSIERVVINNPNARARSTDNELWFDSDHKALTSFWKNSYWFYSDTGVSIEFQEKHRHCFLWWCWDSWDRSDAGFVSLNVSYARVYYWNQGYENWLIWQNESRTGTGGVSLNLGWNVFGIVDVPELHVDYQANYNGSSRNYHFDW